MFEPQDSDKGDIARACFYMMARYNNLANDDTVSSDNPNLFLVNEMSYFSSSAYTSTTSKCGTLGLLGDLLEWNRLDPPDEFEIHRNNLLYRNFTNNRNPFIDFPECAEAIWGTSEEGIYDFTPTFKVSAANDLINGDQYALSSTSITISETNGTKKVQIKCAKDLDVTWTVDDDTLVSLDKTTSKTNEYITITAGSKEGSTKVRATIVDGDKAIERVIDITIKFDKNLVLDTTTLIIIGVSALLVVIVIILILVISKSARKQAGKIIKKQIKKHTKKPGKKSGSNKKK